LLLIDQSQAREDYPMSIEEVSKNTACNVGNFTERALILYESEGLLLADFCLS
jgi:hypothetical protein